MTSFKTVTSAARLSLRLLKNRGFGSRCCQRFALIEGNIYVKTARNLHFSIQSVNCYFLSRMLGVKTGIKELRFKFVYYKTCRVRKQKKDLSISIRILSRS